MCKGMLGNLSSLRACEYNEVRCVRGSADHGATRRAITTPPVHRLPSTKTQIWISERQLWLYPLTEHLGVTGMAGLWTRRVPGVKSAVAVFVWYCMPPDLAAEAAARHERHEREATSGQRRPDAKRVRRSSIQAGTETWIVSSPGLGVTTVLYSILRWMASTALPPSTARDHSHRRGHFEDAVGAAG